MPPLPAIIAIDGPVASGKSSVGKRLADRLGYLFFDTGLLYRAITYLALRDRIPLDDPAALELYALRAHVDVQPPTVQDGRDCTVLAEGDEDITWELRSKTVEDSVSVVAAVPGVRRVLTSQMRRIGLRGRVVMVGRDVGTVILPEAGLKFFITASVEARARRRFAEAQAGGRPRTYADILANLRERDRIDSSRQAAPLRPADDALQLDTTDLDLDGVVAALTAALAARADP
ncbi:MAG: (d)CMP kinase [Anaerolineales bacterium]|nr:(d)CMP kinase [Anaerolineales bacterium]